MALAVLILTVVAAAGLFRYSLAQFKQALRERKEKTEARGLN
jgi:hypothetical protein